MLPNTPYMAASGYLRTLRRRASNVRLWLGADIQRESAELPLLTLSGHPVEYGFSRWVPKTSVSRTLVRGASGPHVAFADEWS